MIVASTNKQFYSFHTTLATTGDYTLALNSFIAATTERFQKLMYKLSGFDWDSSHETSVSKMKEVVSDFQQNLCFALNN